MTPKKKTKRNPNDLTVRNLRAMSKRIKKIEDRIDNVLKHSFIHPLLTGDWKYNPKRKTK